MKSKTFDCVKMKHDIQQAILQDLAGLSSGQQRRKTEELIESDPVLARIWRRGQRVAGRSAPGE